MNWFLIALINPIAHAFVNHFDKYLISRFTKESSVGALILFSSLFAIVALPILLLINPTILSSIALFHAFVLMVNGALLMVAVLFYLYALEHDEASHVVPFFQLVPVLSFGLGYFVLGEVLHKNQLFAAMFIVIGSTILALEMGESKTKLKTKLILLMLGSSLFYAINAVIFKYIAVEQGFTSSLFWDMLGKVLFGVLLFVAIKSYRKDFIGLLKDHHYSIVLLNIINEIIGLAGDIAIVYAVIFAPVALVQSVGGLQPVMVFVFGVILTLLLPKFGTESMLKKHLAQKILGIAVITIGVYLLEFK